MHVVLRSNLKRFQRKSAQQVANYRNRLMQNHLKQFHEFLLRFKGDQKVETGKFHRISYDLGDNVLLTFRI